jgi:hypothetical protein
MTVRWAFSPQTAPRGIFRQALKTKPTGSSPSLTSSEEKLADEKAAEEFAKEVEGIALKVKQIKKPSS